MTPQAPSFHNTPLLAQPIFLSPRRQNTHKRHRIAKHKINTHNNHATRRQQHRVQPVPPRHHHRPDPPGDEPIVNQTPPATFPLSTPIIEPVTEHTQLPPPLPKGRPIPTLLTPNMINKRKQTTRPTNIHTTKSSREQSRQPMTNLLTTEMIEAIDKRQKWDEYNKRQEEDNTHTRTRPRSTTPTLLTPSMIKARIPFDPFPTQAMITDTMMTKKKPQSTDTTPTSKSTNDTSIIQPALDGSPSRPDETTRADTITTTAASAMTITPKAPQPSTTFRVGTYLRRIISNMAKHIGSAVKRG